MESVLKNYNSFSNVGSTVLEIFICLTCKYLDIKESMRAV